MKYVLQNVILPNRTVCNEIKMYYRQTGLVMQNDTCLFLKMGAKCDFSSYFNSFSFNKWLRYTKLDNLNLCVKIKGHFQINIYTAYWYCKEAIKNCVFSGTFVSDGLNWIDLTVDEIQDGNIYFEIVALDNDVIFYEGQYYTDIDFEKLNSIDIDLVMCTFKRETYVKRNIDLIVNHYLSCEKYNGAKHFRIIVVDNGQTLNKNEIEIPNIVKLFPNINTGGSGGFTRGMMESLKDNFATHILLMDDDVLVQVEAFERTYNLLCLLKDKYKNAFLGGAMLRHDKKYYQYEIGAAFKGNRWLSLKEGLNLNIFTDVLFNEKYENANGAYCGWWYCCFPRVIVVNNLPYPFFIKMDDIEYSIRNCYHVISLNGISVWHEAFDKKYSTLMEDYFMFRNSLVVNAIHDIGDLKLNLIFLLRRFAHEIFRYDYKGAELLLDGVDRFLEGPAFFQNIDTVQDLKEHGSKQEKLVSIDAINDFDMLKGSYDSDLSKIHENKLVKAFRFITWNGHLLPNCFFKDFGFAEYGYRSHSKMFFGKKKVVACDKNFDTAVILTINRSRFLTLLIRYFKLNLRMIKNYNSIKREYKNTFKYMTSEEFWNKYLKLDLQKE